MAKPENSQKIESGGDGLRITHNVGQTNARMPGQSVSSRRARQHRRDEARLATNNTIAALTRIKSRERSVNPNSLIPAALLT